MDTSAYIHLSEILTYPGKDYTEKVNACQEYMNQHYPEAGKTLETFTDFMQYNNFATIEETYMRTFDVQAVCSIYVGYVLFGEDYKRGAVLANLNKEHREAGNKCHNELADHLPNLLKLVPKLEDQETCYELVSMMILPAIEKIIGEFGDQKLQAKEKVYFKHHRTLLESPVSERLIYKYPLLAVRDVILQDFPELAVIEEEEAGDDNFIRSVNQEMQIEDSSK